MELLRFLVAVGARHGDMAPVKGKTSCLVLHQGEGGRLITFEVVALLTSIEIRRGDELTRVAIPVTIGTLFELHLV